MKKILIPVLASVLLFSCQQEKTAFVDNEKLIEESQEKKDLEADYEKRIADLGKKKDSIANALKSEFTLLEPKLQALQKSNPAKAQELYLPFQQKQQILSNGLQNEEKQIANSFQAKIDSLLSKVDTSIEDYGNNNGYTYIFGKNKAGSVLYGADKKDITQAVVDKLNKEYSESK